MAVNTLSRSVFGSAYLAFVLAASSTAQDVQILYQEAKRTFMFGAYDDTIRWLDRAIESGLREKRVYRCRAFAKLLCGNPRAAIADFTTAIRLDSDDTGLYYGRGAAHYFVGNFRAASDDLAESLRRYPDYWGASSLRTEVLFACEDLIGALQETRRSSAIEKRVGVLPPGTSCGIGRKMTSFEDTGPILLSEVLAFEACKALHEECRKSAETAARGPPSAMAGPDAKVSYAEAMRSAADGDLNASLGGLSAAIALAPENCTMHRVRGAVWILKGDLNEALADLNKAIALKHSDLPSFQLRSRIYDELGQREKSKADLETAIKLVRGIAEKTPQAQRTRGREDGTGAIK
jgi:tetratricopeptide (TPR) repeat protein